MLEDVWKKLIKRTVYKYLPADLYQIFLFGSRAEGTNRKWSDADIGLLGQQKVPAEKLVEIESDLSESDIPYLVEVVDFKFVTPEFAKIALKTKIDLWPKS